MIAVDPDLLRRVRAALEFIENDAEDGGSVTREEAHELEVCMDAVECDRCCCPRSSFNGYMVHDTVWSGEAGLPHYGCVLCLECLEAVLGRRLTAADFTRWPVNDWLGERLGFRTMTHAEVRALNEARRG